MSVTKKPEPSTEQGIGFSDFWGIYPRRVGKRQAEQAFANALKRASASEIMAGAQRYKDDLTRKPEFTAYPATWLNGDRWLDEAGVDSSVRSDPEPTNIALRFGEEPEGITLSEWLNRYASPDEKEKARLFGLEKRFG